MKHLLKIFLLIGIFTFNSLTINSQTWVEQSSGVTVTLTSVSAFDLNIDNQTVWVCGYNGTVLRSTNYGTNWINVSLNGIPSTALLINIASIDRNNALTAGYIGANTFVYKTTNGGANWTQVFTEANGFINAICMEKFNINNGLMMGDPVGGRWSLWRTTDRGATWDSAGLYLPQAGTEAGWNNSMTRNGSNVWFGTSNSRIYYSSNNGTSWTAQSTGSEINSYAVNFSEANANEGLAGGGGLLRTSNFGTNWTSQTSPGTGNFGGITTTLNFPPGSSAFFRDIFYVRSSNVIYYSSDNGVTWVSMYTAPAGTYRYITSYTHPATLNPYIFAVRNNGGISFAVLPVGITQLNSEVPDKFFLSQNYPNPFNPSTKIDFAVPRASNVSLKVYDALGKQVADLVSKFLTAGNYTADFTASKGLTSGVYYYRLTAGEFSDTKKLMLVK